jgi:hypothetical protein
MPKQEEYIDIEVDEDDLDEYDESDFGFIISSSGELKSMMIPDLLMEDPPIEVKKILKIFGIKNIHTIDSRTIH